MSINDLKYITNPNIIDIRDKERYSMGHVDGAVNVPFDSIMARPYDYLDKNLVYYIYCNKGNTSLRLCNLLNSMGFHTVSLTGGYDAWNKSI